jgi:hypothetical protein
MTTPRLVNAADQAAAEAIRQQLATQISRICNDPRRSVAAIRADVAAAYLAPKNRMTALQDAAGVNAETTRRTLMQRAFAVPSDAASALSFRDACDRAEGIDNETEALALINRAADTNDSTLATALALRGYEMGWDSVLQVYAKLRPNAVAAINQLSQTRTRLTAGDLFAFILPVPDELSGLTDWAMQTLVDTNAAQPTG